MTKAEQTRRDILNKAADLIYQFGYQATSIDKIILTTQVTKGAFYYHFKNKEQMGIAVVKEVIQPRLQKNLIDPLKNSKNPLSDIYDSIERKLLKDSDYYVDYGCPTNNLVQEMGPLNIKFYKALRGVLDSWVREIEHVLSQGKTLGMVNREVDVQSAARFIVSGYEGLKSLGKIYGRDLYQAYLKQLKSYLNSLS